MIPQDILNYRVVRHLGSGGMGSVYLAVNTSIDQQVAIKVLRPEMASNAILRARFKQEAQLLCSLDHPGIVKFLNYVETGNGVFLIMEYVKGVTLEDFIKKRNGLIVEQKAYPMMCEILDAFAYAHAKGIVHRDIKPSNIILQEDGHIKVMDFGIAQIVSEASGSAGGAAMGTPTYMSPEQIYGKTVDTRSDIYSLGVLFHNMLTGRAPYDSTALTAQEIKSRVVREVLPRMSDYYPYISDGIQRVVDKATQKDPQARYQSCVEMRRDVKKALAPDPIPRSLIYGGVAALLVLLLGGFLTWDYYRTKVDYYKDYVEVFGIPEGIGSLSGNEMRHREASYRFEYSKRRLRRVSYVNSRGNLVSHHDSEDKDKIVDMTLTYTEGSGKVDAVKYKDQCGKVLYVKDYDSNFKTCTFKLDDELGTEMTLNAQVELFQSVYDLSVEGKSKISKYILQYNEDGYLTKVEYAGFGNIRVPDGHGVFGKSYVLDKHGRVLEEHNLGKDGKPKATQFGLGVKKFTYDDDDNLVRIDYLTCDGKPSSDGNNCPVVLLTYDKWGNRVSEKYTDAQGQPMVRKDNAFAGIVYTYDDEGFCVRHDFLGIDGGPTYVYGFCSRAMEYDENGYLSKTAYIGANGKGAYYNDNSDNDSYAFVQYKNDEHGNVLDISKHDIQGNLIETAGSARCIFTYDSVGNNTSMYYVDEDGQPMVVARDGYAGVEQTFNEQGRVESITYMDTARKPMVVRAKNVCKITQEYDVRGNITKTAYLDDKDKPAMSDEGIAAACYEYDENGNETARYFLDAAGKPCVLNRFCHKAEMTYDEAGNQLSVTYYNASGGKMSVNGTAQYVYEYDVRGNTTRIRSFAANGKLSKAWADERSQFDDRNNPVSVAYYNADGKPALCDDGYHKVVRQFASNNLCVREEYYGTSGTLKNVANNKYAVRKMEYDDRGNQVSETYFTETGERGCDNNKVHKYYNQYDKIANKVSHQISFGVDGKPISVAGAAPEGRITYDKKGNMLSLACYDGNGGKINGQNGWHDTRYTYDESGEKLSQAYYSLDGKAVSEKNMKYHKVAYEYDGWRNVITETYYGTDGKKTENANGVGIVRYKYNDLNQRTEEAYFGSNGKPKNCGYGYQRVVYTFKNGTEHSCVIYDANKKKIATGQVVNGQWQLKGTATAPSPSRTTTTPGWYSVWKSFAKECPIDVDGVGTIAYILVESDGVIMTIVQPEQVASNYLDFVREYVKYLKKETGIPSYVPFTAGIYNKNWDRQYTVTIQ